jgi:hypothetical protein
VKRFPSGGWAVISVVVALLFVPAAVGATTASIVELRGPSGVRAQVTPAQQLQTAEAPPSSFQGFTATLSPGCTNIFTVPATQGYVLRQLTVAGTTGDYVTFYADSNCTGAPFTQAIPISGDAVLPLDPGVGLAAGATVSANFINNGGIPPSLYGLGYLVPTADMPATTPFAAARSRR